MPDAISIPSPVIAAYRLYGAGQGEAALSALTEAGSTTSGSAAGQLLLGALEIDRRRHKVAATSFQRAALLDPRLGSAWANLAVALRRLNRLEDALIAADRAMRLEPGNLVTRNGRSAVLLDLDRPAPALIDAEAVLASDPGNGEALVNRGQALQRLGRLGEARAVLDEAVQRRPEDPAARHARAYLRLLTGDLPGGWGEREARWSIGSQSPMPKIPDVPLWNGEALGGRPLLVVGDEGRGDMIQYVRLLCRPPFEGTPVILQVPNYMVRLFAPSLPGVTVTASPPDQAVAFQTPLSRIPAVLAIGLGDIPADVPYLSAEPERVGRWQARIGDHGFRIGLCWQGNPDTAVDRGRSVPLAAFAPLAAVPGVRLIALQARHGVDQLANLPPGMKVETLGPDYDTGPDSFVDPAAAMQAVDVVVSSDTALAHLAGALARPLWVVLRRIPDFRWLLDRSDSPWYPTARLFRQEAEGDWDGVVRRIATAVRDGVS